MFQVKERNLQTFLPNKVPGSGNCHFGWTKQGSSFWGNWVLILRETPANRLAFSRYRLSTKISVFSLFIFCCFWVRQKCSSLVILSSVLGRTLDILKWHQTFQQSFTFSGNQSFHKVGFYLLFGRNSLELAAPMGTQTKRLRNLNNLSKTLQDFNKTQFFSNARVKELMKNSGVMENGLEKGSKPLPACYSTAMTMRIIPVRDNDWPVFWNVRDFGKMCCRK